MGKGVAGPFQSDGQEDAREVAAPADIEKMKVG